MTDKADLRQELRALRAEHAAAIPDNVKGLLFRHPPAPLLKIIPESAVVGLYHAAKDEAPAGNYARYFSEAGYKIALPRFAQSRAAMDFAEHSDPFGESDLELGSFGMQQPATDAPNVIPGILFVPIVGFTDLGERLGQGGGHYDRWLAAHPSTVAIGMAWDCQKIDFLAVEAHDVPMHAIVTPTRFYGPF